MASPSSLLRITVRMPVLGVQWAPLTPCSCTAGRGRGRGRVVVPMRMPFGVVRRHPSRARAQSAPAALTMAGQWDDVFM